METKPKKDQGGVPIGGTTGQALVKLSNADNDVGFATIGAGSGANQNYYKFVNNFMSGSPVLVNASTFGPSTILYAIYV